MGTETRTLRAYWGKRALTTGGPILHERKDRAIKIVHYFRSEIPSITAFLAALSSVCTSAHIRLGTLEYLNTPTSRIARPSGPHGARMQPGLASASGCCTANWQRLEILAVLSLEGGLASGRQQL